MTWGSVGFAQKWPIETSFRGKPFTLCLEYFRACSLLLLLLTQLFYFYQSLFLHKYLHFYFGKGCTYPKCFAGFQPLILVQGYLNMWTGGGNQTASHVTFSTFWAWACTLPCIRLKEESLLCVSSCGFFPRSLLRFRVCFGEFSLTTLRSVCRKTVAVLSSPGQRALLDQLWTQRARSLS